MEAVPAANPPDVFAMLSSGPTEQARTLVLNHLRNVSRGQGDLGVRQLSTNPYWAAWLRQAGFLQ